MHRSTRHALLGATFAAVALMACSSDEDDGNDTSSGGAGTSSSGGSTSLTLYQRLGEEPGLTTFVDKLVVEELKDADIASYFFFQSSGASGGPAAGHPSVAAIKGCLVAQLGNAVGGPQSYPTTAAGHTCRDMVSAHATLGIPGGVFDRFVGIAAAMLQPAVVDAPTAAGQISKAEFDTIAGFLTGTKTAIAQDKTRTDGPFLQPDAGN